MQQAVKHFERFGFVATLLSLLMAPDTGCLEKSFTLVEESSQGIVQKG